LQDQGLVEKLAAVRAGPVKRGRNPSPPSSGDFLLRGTFWADILPLLLSVVSVGAITVLLLLPKREVAATLVPLAYLIPVIVAATQWGVWAGLLASIASMVAADYLFFPPIYSFQVEDPREAVDLLMFLVVALVSSNLAARLRAETTLLRRREKEIHQLYEFSQRLAACFTVSDLVAAVQSFLARALGPHATLFMAMADGRLEPPESKLAPAPIQSSIAAMAAAVGLPPRTITDPLTHDVWLLRAVSSETVVHGVIAINLGTGSPDIIRLKQGHVEAILEEVALTLQRIDVGKALEEAKLHLQAQLLRDAFHGTLSHELCSPLAAIRGSASVLSTMSTVQQDAQARSLVDAISEETADLDGHIQNLLNATRVTAGGLTPKREWADPRDIVNAAVKRRARRLSAHKVEVTFADDLPLVDVDSGLIEEAFGQLLENAAKYSPSGSTVSVTVSAEQASVRMSVSDQGAGITADEHAQIGNKSFRSPRHQTSIPGSGLGFWIASIFVRAHGGTVNISSPGQGMGTTVSISLPASQPTVSEPAACENE
jgi:two-component system sensor histidine kinase KdpD